MITLKVEIREKGELVSLHLTTTLKNPTRIEKIEGDMILNAFRSHSGLLAELSKEKGSSMLAIEGPKEQVGPLIKKRLRKFNRERSQ